MSRHFWPAVYLVLAAVSFYWYWHQGEHLEDIHFAVAGFVLGNLGIMEMVWGGWLRDELDRP